MLIASAGSIWLYIPFVHGECVILISTLVDMLARTRVRVCVFTLDSFTCLSCVDIYGLYFMTSFSRRMVVFHLDPIFRSGFRPESHLVGSPEKGVTCK